MPAEEIIGPDQSELSPKPINEELILNVFKIKFSEIERAAGFIKEQPITTLLLKIKTGMNTVASYYLEAEPDPELYYAEIRKELELIEGLINTIPDRQGFHKSIKTKLDNSVTPLLKEIRTKMFPSSEQTIQTESPQQAQQLMSTQPQVLRAANALPIESKTTEMQENKGVPAVPSSLVALSLLSNISKNRSAIPDMPLVIHARPTTSCAEQDICQNEIKPMASTTIETEIHDVRGDVDATYGSFTNIPSTITPEQMAQMSKLRSEQVPKGPIINRTKISRVTGKVNSGMFSYDFAGNAGNFLQTEIKPTEPNIIVTEIGGTVSGHVDTTCFSATNLPANASLEPFIVAMRNGEPIRSVTRITNTANMKDNISAGIGRFSFANPNNNTQPKSDESDSFSP